MEADEQLALQLEADEQLALRLQNQLERGRGVPRQGRPGEGGVEVSQEDAMAIAVALQEEDFQGEGDDEDGMLASSAFSGAELAVMASRGRGGTYQEEDEVCVCLGLV